MRITISAGVAAAKSGKNGPAVVEAADKALYREPTGLFDRELIHYHAIRVVAAEPVE